MNTQTYIALGSNLGNRQGNIIAALEKLRQVGTIHDVPSIYETEPWGAKDQPYFLNAVCSLKTQLSPQKLLLLAKQIETELDRQPTIRYGPRTIDVDVLLYGNSIINTPDLQIPHPRMTERGFVLRPLIDIAPSVVHPALNKTIQQLIKKTDISGVKLWSRRPLVVDNHMFHWGYQTYIMGILNITPDSFSGDGIFHENRTSLIERAVLQVRKMKRYGAHIIDVGGESTRPGAKIVDIEEECSRVVPIIKVFHREGLGPISIDTYKSAVAEAAIDAGADMVNDVWGLRYDKKMASLIAKRNVPVVIMHNRSKPTDVSFQKKLSGRYVGSQYGNLLKEVKNELAESIAIAHRAGIPDHHIIIDPGIGFGKTVAQNLELLNKINELTPLDKPILIGPSRKSFIGYTLDLPSNKRREGTAAAVAIGIDRGADMIRVHDVKEMVRVARMTDAIVRNK